MPPAAEPQCDRCYEPLGPDPTAIAATGGPLSRGTWREVTLCPECARVLEVWLRTNPRSPRLKELRQPARPTNRRRREPAGRGRS